MNSSDKNAKQSKTYKPSETPNVPKRIELGTRYPRLSKGQRKALIIGATYTGTPKELKASYSDAKAILNLVENEYLVSSENIKVLTDEPSDSFPKPTLKNIIVAMNWLMNDAQPHDSLFIYFSGHGCRVPDEDGDEEDGMDEAIVTCDEKAITDDLMNSILVERLPAGARMLAIFDCCYSEVNSCANDEKMRAATALKTGHRGFFRRMFPKSVKDPPKLVMFGSSHENEVSFESTDKSGQPHGAMTRALLSSLDENPLQSCGQLLLDLRKHVVGTFSQMPQLSTLHEDGYDDLFVI